MKIELQSFQKEIISGYEHRINSIDVAFDDEKMKQQLHPFSSCGCSKIPIPIR
ncbi:hypothetical protein [Flavobacterium sp. W20_MBD1_R3]|uniref:hypothetical protein n=1 Tax=Flavobacterium sp. W20_MBD1_R3 TaxID=3240278 RepID=UPI003F9215C9